MRTTFPFLLIVLFSITSCKEEEKNSAPIAHAGNDKEIPVLNPYQLDASLSSDEDGDDLAYTWKFMSIPDKSQAELNDTQSMTPEFIPDKTGVYTLQLIVNDGIVDSEPDEITLTAVNEAGIPQASAGNDTIVKVGTDLQLDGSNSSSPYTDELSYSWSVSNAPEGANARISDTQIVNPIFTADLVGDYEISLVVNDGVDESEPDNILISVAEQLAAPEISLESGTYKGIQTVTINNPNNIGEVFLTLDGSEPTPELEPFNTNEPIYIKSESTIKAIVAEPSSIQSQTAIADIIITGTIFDIQFLGELELNQTDYLGNEMDLSETVIADSKLFIGYSFWDLDFEDPNPINTGKISIYDISDNENPASLGALRTVPITDLEVYSNYLIASQDVFGYTVYSIGASSLNREVDNDVFTVKIRAKDNKVYPLEDGANQEMNSYDLLNPTSTTQILPVISAAGEVYFTDNNYTVVTNAILEDVPDWDYKTNKMVIFDSADNYVYYDYSVTEYTTTSDAYKNFVFLNYWNNPGEGIQNLDVVSLTSPLNPISLGLMDITQYAYINVVEDYLFVSSYNSVKIYYLGDLIDSLEDIYLVGVIEGDYASYSARGASIQKTGDNFYVYIVRDVPGEKAKLTYLKAEKM